MTDPSEDLGTEDLATARPAPHLGVIHQYLKRSTAAQHGRLESLSPLTRMLSAAEFSNAVYGDILLDFAEIFEVFEPLSERSLLPFTSPAQSASGQKILISSQEQAAFFNRRSLLLADLEKLELTPRRCREEIQELVRELTPSLETTSWGVAYVLLGQMLGATQIVARFCKMKSFNALTTPLQFFSWHQSSNRRFWPFFLAALNEHFTSAQNPVREELLLGASKTFQAFETLWIQRGTARADH